MKKDPSGGPAFPSELGVNFERGISKREYFAAAALTGFLSNSYILESLFGAKKGDAVLVAKEIREQAFAAADAMIIESEKP